jgi:hypothetical protein
VVKWNSQLLFRSLDLVDRERERWQEVLLFHDHMLHGELNEVTDRTDGDGVELRCQDRDSSKREEREDSVRRRGEGLSDRGGGPVNAENGVIETTNGEERETILRKEWPEIAVDVEGRCEEGMREEGEIWFSTMWIHELDCVQEDWRPLVGWQEVKQS